VVPPAPQVIVPSGEHGAPATPSSALVDVVLLDAGAGAAVTSGGSTPLLMTVFVTTAGVG